VPFAGLTGFCIRGAVLALLSFAVLGIAASASALAAPDRIALVIGNGRYANVTPLKNAQADAEAIAKTLSGMGFDVIKVIDAGRGQMNEAIGAFLDKAGPSTDALLYYAGHGVELSGANYLLPVDVPGLKPGQERLLRAESISLTELLLELEGRRSRVTVAILDACRDNPFPPQGTRSLGSTRGLARVDPPSGSFVVFSAGAGEQALDVLGPDDNNPNGLFTRRFLSLVQVQGLELRQMTLRLRREVTQLAETAKHKQVPSYYDQMIGSFYFRPPVEKPAAAPAVPVATAPSSERPAATRTVVANIAVERATSAPAGGSQLRLPPNQAYYEPRIDGKRLDWCLTWAAECGFPAADAFCKSQGKRTARYISREVRVNETRLIGEDKSCKGDTCASFFRINCGTEDVVPVVPASREIILHERQGYNRQCEMFMMPVVSLDKPLVGGKIVTREVPMKVSTVTKGFEQCKGLDIPGLQVVFISDPGFTGPVRAEFRSRVTGQADVMVNVDLEVR
jgi:hypothetical protein